jgi:hypothetical protein
VTGSPAYRQFGHVAEAARRSYYEEDRRGADPPERSSAAFLARRIRAAVAFADAVLRALDDPACTVERLREMREAKEWREVSR